MRKPVAWTLMWAMLVAGSLSLTGWADNKPALVGKVIDVDGPLLMTNRMTEDRWYQGYVEMPTYLSERLKADSQTSATIQFYKGGRAVISPGTQVEVVTTKSLRTLKVEMGTVWAKFDKQESEFRIQTAGGVMGIEGTEFFVEAGEDGDTKLTVVEGQVRVLSGDDEKVVANGEEANFKRGVRRFRRFAAGSGMTLRERRQAAFLKLGLEGKPFQRYILTRGLTKRQSKRLSRLFYQRLLSRRSAPQIQVTLQDRHYPRRAPQPFELAALEQPDGKPRISWNRGLARSYAVVISNDEAGENVVWQGRTNSPSFTYPDYGPELEPDETYFVAVTPLRFDGSPHLTPDGKSLYVTASFVAQGHLPEYGPVSGVEISAGEGPPQFQWAESEAAAYQLKILSANQPVWIGESENTRYSYPEAARALEPGRYSAVVESFDQFGIKMGESETLDFETEGWTSTGLEGPPRE